MSTGPARPRRRCAGSARPGRTSRSASAARCARHPSPSEHQHVVDVRSRGADVHLPAVLPAVHRPAGRPALPRRAGPLPLVPGLRARPGRLGRPADPGRAGVPVPQLGAGPDRRVLSRARPGPPSPSCRWRPGTASWRRTRAWHRAARTSRRCWCAAPATTTGSAATSCRSTPATSWSAGCADLARVRRRPGGTRRPRRVLRPGRRPQPARRRCARERRWTFRVLDVAPSRTPRRPQLTARLRIEESDRRAGARDRAALPGPHRAAAAAATTRRDEAGAARPVRRPGALAADTLKPFQWMQCNTTVQGFTGSHRGRPGAAVHLRLRRDRVAATCTRSGGHPPAEPAVLRHRLHPRRARLRGAAGALGRARRATSCRCGSGSDMIATFFPDTGWIRLDHDVLAALGDYRARHGLIVVGGDGRASARPVTCPVGRERRERVRPTASSGPAPSPTRCSTRATCSTPTGPARTRTASGGSSGSSARPARPTRGLGEDPTRWPMQCLLTGATTGVRGRPSTCGSCSSSTAQVERAPATAARAGRRTAVGRPVVLTWDEAVEQRDRGWPRRPVGSPAADDRRSRSPGGEDVERAGRRRAGPCAAGGRSRAAGPPSAPSGRRPFTAAVGDGAQRPPRPAGDRPRTRIRYVAARRPPARRGATAARFVSTARPAGGRRRGRRRAAASTAAGRCWPGDRGRHRPRCSGRRSSSTTTRRSPRRAPGALFDATEIDEILTLRVMTMTDAEKAEARATDPRAAAIIDRCDAMTPGGPAAAARRPAATRTVPDRRRPTPPWWDPGRRRRGRPGDRHRRSSTGCRVGKGSLVRRAARAGAPTRRTCSSPARSPGSPRCSFDVDGETHVAVVLEDDPAADLHDWYGRYFYFAPDEIEPLTEREESRP